MQGDIREGRKRTSLASAVLLGVCLTVASACSSTDDEADQAASTERTPGDTESFPALASVPERPATSTPEQRRELTEGLVSDRARSKYSDEAIAFQGEPAAPLQPPEQMVTEAKAPSTLASEMKAVTPPFSGSPEALAEPVPSPTPSAPPPSPSPSPSTSSPSTSPQVPAGIEAATGTPSEPEGMSVQAVAPPFSGSTSSPPQPFPPPETDAPAAVAATAAAPPPVGGTDRALEPGFLGPTSTPPPSFVPPPATSTPATAFAPPPAASAPAAPAPTPMVAAVSDPFAPPPPATGAPSALQARSGGVENTYQPGIQEPLPMGGMPFVPPTIPPVAEPDKPLVTVVVSSQGVETYRDRPVFLPELSPAPTRFDRFPSPGGLEPMESATAGSGSGIPGTGSAMAGRGSVTAGSGSVSAGRGSLTAGSGSLTAGSGSVSAGRGSLTAGSGSVTVGSGSVTAGSGSVRVATILFDDGSTSLGNQEKGILQQVAELHRRRGGTVRVVGHASSRTRNMEPDRHRSVNYRLSVERASAVARELAKLGVPGEMIVVSAMADEEPVYHEVMPSGEAGNRRDEIYIDY